MKPHIKQLRAVHLTDITDLSHGSLCLSSSHIFFFYPSTVNTAKTGLTASTNPLSHNLLPLSAEPRLLCCFHLLLYEWSWSQSLTETDSCCRMKKKKHSPRPWTHRITPHSRCHPPSIRSKQNASTALPRTRLLFGDCAGCFCVQAECGRRW